MTTILYLLSSIFDPRVRCPPPNAQMPPKLPLGLEPRTSSLPRKCSTTELWQRFFEPHRSNRGRYRVPLAFLGLPKANLWKNSRRREPNRHTFGAYRNYREGKSIFPAGRVSNGAAEISRQEGDRWEPEIRNPKPEIRRNEENPKSEGRSDAFAPLRRSPTFSDLGLRISFGFLVSDFGLLTSVPRTGARLSSKSAGRCTSAGPSFPHPRRDRPHTACGYRAPARCCCVRGR